ncbi:Hypothetical predicted protein [Paramuricea clavata]|nr:Hypothetical predicted protein [Paramuricea clavata]
MQWFNHVKNYLAMKPLAIFNATAFFRDIVSNYFGNNCSECKGLVQKLIIMADSDKNGNTSQTEAIWFGSLLLTQETFMLAAMNESRSTVNLNGYCGALYAVEKVHISSSYLVDTSKAFTDFWGLPEFAEPIESFFKDILGELRNNYTWFETLHEYIYIFIKRLRQDKVPSLQQRIQFILGSLEMLSSLVSFQYGEVMWCDILYENIGFTNTEKFSSVKLTDLDEVFSVRKVFQNVSKNDNKKCATNTDCLGENYDVGLYYQHACSPYCQNTSLCSHRPQKSNLGYLCDTLFFDVIFNPVVMALSEQVMSNRIGSTIYWILNDCAKSVEWKTIGEYLASIGTVHAKFRNVTIMLDMDKN